MELSPRDPLGAQLDGSAGVNHRRLIGYQRTCRWNDTPDLSVEQQRALLPPLKSLQQTRLGMVG